MSDIKQFLKAEKQSAGNLVSLSVSLGLANGLLLIVQAWLLATVINEVIFLGRELADVMPFLWGMLVTIATRSAVTYFAEQAAFSSAALIKQSLRERLYEKLQKLGPAYLSNERTGEIATVLTDGIEAMEAYYARYLPAMSLAVFIPLSILVFVIPVDWQSALVFLVTAPLIPFFMIMIGKGAEKLNQKQWKQLQRMGAHFLDVIQGLTTLKMFNASRRESAVIARISEDYRAATMKVLRVAFLSALALEFFATVSIAVVAVLIGFRLLFGDLDFYSGFFVLLLAPEFYLPLRSLGMHYHARMNAIGAAEKMIEILGAEEFAHEGRVLEQQFSALQHPINIRFDHVGFSYKANVPVINDFSLEVNAGETVAIVGPTGGGKTTLQNLLLGFIRPDTGHILINGVSLAKVDITEWYSHVSWVPQKPRLFHGTIAENITLGLSGVSFEEIRQAAEQANAMEFIEQLAEGFDTLVGDGARQLSGGQLQRLALARAFLRKPSVILLDEATANLDAHNEQLLQQAINRLTPGRAVVMIAHRLSTVRHADKIVVLEQGGISQLGNHAALIQEEGLYRHLASSQGALA